MPNFFPKIVFPNKTFFRLTYHHPQPTPDLPTFLTMFFYLCTVLLTILDTDSKVFGLHATTKCRLLQIQMIQSGVYRWYEPPNKSPV